LNKRILERLEALEARRQNVYVPPKPPALSLYLVGFFGGKYDANASPFENCYRAIGCVNANQFYALEQVSERHRAAWTRICKRRGIDSVTLQPWDKVEKMLKKLDRAGIVPAEGWAATPPKPPPPRPPRPPPPPPPP
jgi:hypothetical protein